MKAWLISMIGVVLLLAIAEMLLPDGKLRKNIRGIFSLILMLVIIKPLPQLKNMKLDFNYDMIKDGALLESLEQSKTVALEKDCERILKGKQIEANVTISGKWKGNSIEIGNVVVKSTESIEKIKVELATFLKVDKSKISVVSTSE